MVAQLKAVASCKAYVIHTYPPNMLVRECGYMTHLCSLVGLFVLDSCMAIRHEVDVSVGYILVYMFSNVDFVCG